MLDALPRAIVVTDASGTIIGWNRAAESLYGWPTPEMLGRDMVDTLTRPADRDQARKLLHSVVEGERWEGVFQVVHRDGTIVEVLTIASPLLDAEGRSIGLVGASDDITAVSQLAQHAADLADHLTLALAAGELGTWRWEADSGRTTWDETMERLFGLAPDSFDGTFQSWVDLLHPDDRTAVLDALDRALEERSNYVVDHRVTWPDGTVRWLQGRGKVTTNADGNVTGTIGCTADITDRKIAELDQERRAEHLARIAQLERRERQRLEFFGALTQAALDASDHVEFLHTVTKTAVPRLGDWCAIYHLPEGGTAPEVVVAHADPEKVAWARELTSRYPLDLDAPTGVGAVIRTGQPEFHPVVTPELIDAALESSPIDRDEALAIVDTLQLTSTVTVPLATKRGVVGAIQFVSAESGRSYDESDLALAEAASGRIAEALEYMWVTDQHRHIATILQEALLPPALPEIAGLEVAVRYWAAGASDVGGDFYDVFRIPDGRVAVVIGDVCGTGPDAAALTGIARHTIRAGAKHGQDDAGVLEWVDEAIKNSNRGLFASTCFATLTPGAGNEWTLRSTSGGHPLPVAVIDGRPRTIGEPGTILGIVDTLKSHTGEAVLTPGDSVVFYTDGVTDVRPPYGLSSDDVDAMVARASQEPTADATAESIRDQLDEVLPMAQRSDDTALVVVRVTEPTA